MPRVWRDPIHRTADDLSEQAWVLCFDEFHVTDIADAMILGRLFTRMFERGVVVVANVEEGIAACDALAPEHLELCLQDAAAVAPRLGHYGALFIGSGSAEVLGDYGAGPNHVLPTAGTARSKGGLSVYTFLRVRSWLRIDDGAAAQPLIEDAAWFGRVEGLEAHARSAERRLD